MYRAQKRERPRSGIKHHVERVWPKHERWVRRLVCIAADKGAREGYLCAGKVRACHRRSAANSGTGLKPPSWEVFAACDNHHALQHQRGQPWFEKWLGLKLADVARDLAKQSPDEEMKAAMRAEGLL